MLIKPNRISLLLFFLFVAISAFSQSTYYVRTDGDDSNDGSTNDTDNAWRTISHAVSELSSGDIIVINDGTYSGADNRGITIDKAITLTSTDGYNDGNGVIIDCESLDRAFYITAGATLSGLTIKNGRKSSSATSDCRTD